MWVNLSFFRFSALLTYSYLFTSLNPVEKISRLLIRPYFFIFYVHAYINLFCICTNANWKKNKRFSLFRTYVFTYDRPFATEYFHSKRMLPNWFDVLRSEWKLPVRSGDSSTFPNNRHNRALSSSITYYTNFGSCTS